MDTISGGGTFTRQNIAAINSNFLSLANPDLWVRPQNTAPGKATGTYERPFGSVTAAAPFFKPGMVVGILGVLRDEFVAPLGVNDITLRGMATQPRQATTSGAANGGGATWLSPSAGATTSTTALCKLRAQGWRLENLYFNNAATAAPDVMVFMDGAGDPPVDSSAEHTSFYNCYFTGTDDGISSSGGPNFVTIDSCKFFGFSSTSDTGISYATGAGVHSLYGWEIKHSEFAGNTNHIVAAFNGAKIHHNHFTYIDNTITTTLQIDLTGGQNNSVYDNYFDIPYSTNTITTMFVLGTNDRWYANQFATAVTTTIFSFGQPSS